MKKLVIGALAATAAMTAAPAFAGTHISVGLFTPAPAYYEPAPVVYYPPVQHVYYAPPRQVVYYDNYRGHGYGHDRRYAHWGHPRYYGWNY